MLDVSLESEMISIDHDRNRACYGRGGGGGSGPAEEESTCGPGGNWSGAFGGGGGGAAGRRGLLGGGLLAGLLGGGGGSKGGGGSGGSTTSSWGGGSWGAQEGRLSPVAILGGRLPPCPEMQPLEEKLSEAACCAVVSAYEQSWHAARSPWRLLRSSGEVV